MMCNHKLIDRQRWHIEKSEAEAWVRSDKRIVQCMRKHLHATVFVSPKEAGIDW